MSINATSDKFSNADNACKHSNADNARKHSNAHNAGKHLNADNSAGKSMLATPLPVLLFFWLKK